MNAAKYTRNPNLVAARVDDDIIMMNVESGQYLSINSLGGRIWELLEGHVSIQQITETICDEYEVSEAVCRADVEAFLKQLLELGLAKTV